MAPAKPPAGQFSILYFAAASTYTKKTSEHLPAPVKARDLFDLLEGRYTGIKDKVLDSCAVTVNLEYIDVEEEGPAGADKEIGEGDEVAIIPPVSSG
jgi:molybdopterin converting factor small subunit